MKRQIADGRLGSQAPQDNTEEALGLRQRLAAERDSAPGAHLLDPRPVHLDEVSEEIAYSAAEDEFDFRVSDIEKRQGAVAAAAFADVTFGRATPIRAHLPQWFERKRFSEGYKLDIERALDRFEEWCGKNGVAPTVEAITTEVASRYTHQAFVKSAAHHKTANKDVSCLSSYWLYLGKSLGRRVNPWAEQRVEAPSDRHGPRGDKKRPFTSDEVTTLLAGLRGERERNFSLVAALSGMREDEIASLKVGDCRAGFFSISRSKTEAGVRAVPIHSGLAALVARLSVGKQEGDWLFSGLPDQKPWSKRGRGAPVAQAFTRERRLLKVDERTNGQRQSNIDFHSWRRWFIRSAIRAFEAGTGGFTPWTIARVVGHKVEIEGIRLPLGMTMGRYPGESSKESLRACVEAVKLPPEACKKP